MRAGLLRRVVLPVVAVAVVAVVLPRTGDRPPAAAGAGAASPDVVPLLDDPFATGADADQRLVLQDLWQSWGDDLSPAPEVPAEVTALEFAEGLYVLLGVRAAQAAAALDQARDGEDLAAAMRRLGLSTGTPGITVTALSGGPGCVAVGYVDEPFGRTFYALLEPSDDPAPEPQSPLEGRLLETVRVGTSEQDRATCGLGGVAYSPGAQRALQALEPQVLLD